MVRKSHFSVSEGLLLGSIRISSNGEIDWKEGKKGKLEIRGDGARLDEPALTNFREPKKEEEHESEYERKTARAALFSFCS